MTLHRVAFIFNISFLFSSVGIRTRGKWRDILFWSVCNHIFFLDSVRHKINEKMIRQIISLLHFMTQNPSSFQFSIYHHYIPFLGPILGSFSNRYPCQFLTAFWSTPISIYLFLEPFALHWLLSPLSKSQCHVNDWNREKGITKCETVRIVYVSITPVRSSLKIPSNFRGTVPLNSK